MLPGTTTSLASSQKYLQLANSQQGIRSDEELNKLLKGLVTTAEGEDGVLPNIQIQPLPEVPVFGEMAGGFWSGEKHWRRKTSLMV